MTAVARPLAASPPRHGGLRDSTAALVAGAIVLALVTAYAIASLRAHADGRREAQIELSEMSGAVEAHAGMVWAGAASGTSDGARIAELEDRIAERFGALGALDSGGGQLATLIRAYTDYELAAVQLRAGDDAMLPGRRREFEDASRTLSTVLVNADARYREAAAATALAADVGTATSLVSAAVLLALLFRRSERARRAAAVLDRERQVMRDSEARYGALVRHSSDMTTVIDAAGIVRYHSPSVGRLLGIPMTELLDRPWRLLVHPDDAPLLTELLETAAETEGPIRTLAWRVRRADGGWVELETVASSLLREPNVRGVVLNSRDVTERRELERRLYQQAFHDSLTGLPNRASFMEAAERALDRRRAGVAILLLDLDRFKHVNDSLGHAAGDELLVAVAERIQRSLREGDVAARLAGDEFAILTTDLSNPAAATGVAERVAAALDLPFIVQGHEAFTSASIGVAYATDDARGPSELIRDADAAMYRAKAHPQQRVVVFEEEMHVAAVETLQLETDLRAAQVNGELHLAYQPIIELATGRPVGVEALARWDHPRLGAIGPDRFIPVAEQTGFIREIGWWVLETAARQVSAWRRTPGRGLEDLRLSVNLSTRQLYDRDLADRIGRLLREVELPATNLTLELTEDAFAGSEATLIAALARLRAEGLRVAIDDFGSGYSTLSRLRRLPIDEVKIDRAFIDPLQSAADAAVVRTMLELARALGLRVVAEGVETPAQRDALRTMGCQMAQGYLFGRPVDAETVFGSADLGRGASPAA